MAYSKQLRDALDPLLMPLDGVSGRAMFGAHCYLVDGKMFVIVMGDEFVLKPAYGDEHALRNQFSAAPWSHRPGQTFGRFMSVPVHEGVDLTTLSPFFENAHAARQREPR
ncbi:MAG: TfoX/Sxy family protein [Tepidiformaceae bacterium]